MRPSRLLNLSFAINAVAALAAAIVLQLWPSAIPGLVGIELNASQIFITSLLAAAELAIGLMAALAIHARHEGKRIALITLVAMHLASAGSGTWAVWLGASALILWNVLARILITILLLVGWLLHSRGAVYQRNSQDGSLREKVGM